MKTKNTLILLVTIFISILLLLQLGCDLPIVDPEEPNDITPTVTMDTPTYVTATSAKFVGEIIDEGSSNVTSKGFFWNLTGNPNSENYVGSTVILEQGIGGFENEVVGLHSDTTYFVTAYANNSAGIAYGTSIPFTTEALGVFPSIVTKPASEITKNTAIFHGEVTDEGNSSVFQRGFCWNTSGNPNLSNPNNIIVGSGPGPFSENIEDLISNKTYYVTAYAINDKGASYGNILQVLPLPEVVTFPATSITPISAICGGNISEAGNGIIIKRGICYDTLINPNLSGPKVEHSSGGDGQFTVEVLGLLGATKYYIRAYATNSTGTSYGDMDSLTTDPSPFSCGDILVDPRDNQEYNTVDIDSRCWMAENLNIGDMLEFYNEENPYDNDIIEKYCYHDSSIYCETYGGLYMWDELMDYSYDEGSQGICPEGWYVPTDADWTELVDSHDGNGGKMKEEGYDHWNYPNTDATNEHGFTGLGAGNINLDNFYGFKYSAQFYSSTFFQQSENGTYWKLYHNNSNVGYVEESQDPISNSVRCIKDEN